MSVETTPSRLKALKPEFSRIFKLCKSKDRETSMQGLELACALGQPMDDALDDVTVDLETGTLVRGKRFTAVSASGSSQATLDALLLQQLALAAKGTLGHDLRSKVKKIKCSTPVIPMLEGFESLEELEFFFQGQSRDLIALGALEKLKRLSIKLGFSELSINSARGALKSLNGLQAPALEELEVSGLGLDDVQALSACKFLKRISLLNNSSITSIDCLEASVATLQYLDLSGCTSIPSIKVLSDAVNLEFLDISRLELITDLTYLEKLEKLDSFKFSHCRSIKSLKGVPIKFIKPEKYLQIFNLQGMDSLESLEHMPPLHESIYAFFIPGAPSLRDIEGLKAPAGSLRSLTISKAKITDLNAVASLVNLEELEVTFCPELVDATALGLLEKLHKVSIRDCGKLEVLPSEWKSRVTSLSLTGCPALKPLEVLPDGIATKNVVISNRALLPRAKPSRPLKANAGSIWKLLSTRDVANIQMGLELTLGFEEGVDALLEGVSVKDGKLLRGKRFTGTGPAQPFLDLALFGLMSRASAGGAFAGLAGKITGLEVSLASVSPQLEGFDRLESLTISVSEEITPDLSNFGPLPCLKTLQITGSKGGALLSMKGLVAPELKKLEIRDGIDLQDLSALSNSPAITHLNLQGNKNLIDLSGLAACAPCLLELDLGRCDRLASIAVLGDATRLRSLNLQGCESLASVKPLAHCTSLEVLTVEGCKSLSSLEGLQDLALRGSDFQGFGFTSTEFSLDGCSSLASLKHFPRLNEDFDRLSLCETGALKDLRGLRELPQVEFLDTRSSGLVDLGEIGAMPNLTEVDFSFCEQLGDASPLGTLAKLKSVVLKGTGVKKMPQEWIGPITSIDLSTCNALTSLGRLPSCLTTLICCDSNALHRLDGLDACKLEFLDISLSVTDASSLAGLDSLVIRVSLPRNFEKTKSAALTENFVKSLRGLKSIIFKVEGPWGQLALDLSMFNQFNNMESLNFEDFNFNCDIAELAWLVPIQNLQSLRLKTCGYIASKLGASVYDSPGKVRKLQVRICREANISLPAHLIC